MSPNVVESVADFRSELTTQARFLAVVILGGLAELGFRILLKRGSASPKLRPKGSENLQAESVLETLSGQ